MFKHYFSRTAAQLIVHVLVSAKPYNVSDDSGAQRKPHLGCVQNVEKSYHMEPALQARLARVAPIIHPTRRLPPQQGNESGQRSGTTNTPQDRAGIIRRRPLARGKWQVLRAPTHLRRDRWGM